MLNKFRLKPNNFISIMSNYNYLPWIEKYRPKKLRKIVGQNENINSLKKMLEGGSLPHLLFYGTSGTGKTSTILALATKLYGKNKALRMMKLDASDDRGINSVRDEIKGFADKITIFNKGVKLIILDEADSMTFDAQFALRRIIEKYSDTTRFCLICNYDNKIIPAIKSRCANFKFNPIGSKHIASILKKISIKENLNITTQSINIISKLSHGDLRKGINLLQSISMRSNDITTYLCYETVGIPQSTLIKKIYQILIDDKKDLNQTYLFFKEKVMIYGYSLSILLKELVLYMVDKITELPLDKVINHWSDMSDLEAQVAKSTFGDIYFTALIAIFKKN